MTNFEWITDPLDCVIGEDGMTNVVQTVHWILTGIDENGVSSSTYGSVSFPEPTQEGFIPFDELTKEIVVGWLESVLDVPALEAQIEAQINLINNPVMVQLSLPNQE